MLFLIVLSIPVYSTPSFNSTDYVATGTNKTQTTFYFNVTWDNSTDLHSWIISNNQTGTWVNSTPSVVWINKDNSWWKAVMSFLITAAKNKVFSVVGYANDTLGNINATYHFNTGYGFLVNVTVLNSAPTTPTMIYPVNGQTYSNIPYINYSSTDADGDSLTYKVYINGTLNISTTTNVTTWNASDGYYNLTVSATDGSASSTNSSVILFTLDSSTTVTPSQVSVIIDDMTEQLKKPIVWIGIILIIAFASIIILMLEGRMDIEMGIKAITALLIAIIIITIILTVSIMLLTELGTV